MKHIRLVLGIIGVATATLAAMAQAPASPAPNAPQAQAPRASSDCPPRRLRAAVKVAAVVSRRLYRGRRR
jgi:hypothetical protein